MFKLHCHATALKRRVESVANNVYIKFYIPNKQINVFAIELSKFNVIHTFGSLIKSFFIYHIDKVGR